jgi:hypothetical protein
MDLGAKVSSPAAFGKEHLVLDIFIEALELNTHEVSNGWWEAGGGAEGMQKLVTFFYEWDTLVSVELEPVITS